MKGKTCCIIYNQPRENALADELDVLEQVEYIEHNLNELGVKTYRKGITLDFINEIATLVEEKPDFVFNLVESLNNKGELCYFIPALLNMQNIPYSGNPVEAMFITTSKHLTSRTLKKAGINNPVCFLPSQAGNLIPGKKYIVKPIWEDGSLGITPDSVFTAGPDSFKSLSGYRDTHWMIEEFIDGREFNISVLAGANGPEVMPAAEMMFHNYDESMPRIVDFRAKWEEGSFEYENTKREFPGEKLDKTLNEKIRAAALSCWHVFGLKGYARVDMRVDSKNNPYVIEVNANPCLSPGSGFASATRAAGYDFTKVLQRVIHDLNY
jgi:D-alanine-D-alanine ligase